MVDKKKIEDAQKHCQASPPVKPDENEETPSDSSPKIVGIGASAGGLEAFEQFFSRMSSNSGLAFILVSHLDPEHASMLTEILQRSTQMTVVEVQDGMEVKPDFVYVIPPRREMIISHGILKLNIPVLPRGQRMPIDLFFRSLAQDQGEKSIGIILSGTGSDGTMGLRDIYGMGGIAIVQDPATAMYDGMPLNAIHAGYYTHILPVSKMPETILERISRPPLLPGPLIPVDETAGISHILTLLHSRTGHDFSLYKKNTILRRIERCMFQRNFNKSENYFRFLKENPDEIQNLFKELLINVTSFFRDPEAFQVFGEEILPKYLESKPDSYVFRAWIPGCSTGEEVYSIAILLYEYFEKAHKTFKVQIYGTDLDNNAISTARQGIYLPNISQDMSPERLHRFFVLEKDHYRVKKEIRDMVVFATQNVLKDPPFTKQDLISCRNLMIYLNADIQRRLFLLFHYSLKPEGILFLSPSESIGNHSDLFSAVNRKWKIYQRNTPETPSYDMLEEGFSWTRPSGLTRKMETVPIKDDETNFVGMIRRILFTSYVPASVVTNMRGDILHVHGETGKYLELKSGHPTLNIIDMARDGLHTELRNALQKASKSNEPTLNREIPIKTSDGVVSISLSVRPFVDPQTNRPLLLIIFQDLVKPKNFRKTLPTKGAKKSDKIYIEELERNLALANDSLQSTVEEQQASNEELQSTNEELQSTNEELQSTNEELETSKEELQSINEELVTVNAELQGKIEQLDHMQNDMKNLLDNINMGIIILDEQLNIRRFSREAGKIYRIIDSDIGRPIADIKSNFMDSNDNLLDDARKVLETLVPSERDVQITRNKRYLARIQPYRTMDNVIEGVVITFGDVTHQTLADLTEEKIRFIEEIKEIIDMVREPFAILDNELKIIGANRSFYDAFLLHPEETIGRSIYDLGDQGRWKLPELKELLETVLPLNQSVVDYEIPHEFPSLGRRKILINAHRFLNKKENPQLIYLSFAFI